MPNASSLAFMLFTRVQAALALGRLLRDQLLCDGACPGAPFAVQQLLIAHQVRFKSSEATPASAAAAAASSSSPSIPPRLLVLHPASLSEHSLHEALRLGESFTGGRMVDRAGACRVGADATGLLVQARRRPRLFGNSWQALLVQRVAACILFTPACVIQLACAWQARRQT